MNYLILFFVIVVLYKYFTNWFACRQCKHYLGEYQKHIQHPDSKFLELKAPIIRLFKTAGITDSSVTFVDYIGFDRVLEGKASIFDNLGRVDPRVSGLLDSKFHEAIGVYKTNMADAINPFYWIDFIIHLPQKISKYFGVPTENIFTKIMQAVYWLVGIMITFIYTLFRQEIDQFIRTWLRQLFP